MGVCVWFDQNKCECTQHIATTHATVFGYRANVTNTHTHTHRDPSKVRSSTLSTFSAAAFPVVLLRSYSVCSYSPPHPFEGANVSRVHCTLAWKVNAYVCMYVRPHAMQG